MMQKMKISDIEGKYFTTSDYNKFTSELIDTKIEQKELINKSDISRFINNSDLENMIKTIATKAEIKAEQDKILKLGTYNLSYFPGKKIFRDDSSPNKFVYQPTFKMLQLQKDKGVDYILS